MRKVTGPWSRQRLLQMQDKSAHPLFFFVLQRSSQSSLACSSGSRAARLPFLASFSLAAALHSGFVSRQLFLSNAWHNFMRLCLLYDRSFAVLCMVCMLYPVYPMFIIRKGEIVLGGNVVRIDIWCDRTRSSDNLTSFCLI